jgi:putative glycosyltransferase (TIGR04372 family)
LHVARQTENFLSHLGVSPNQPVVALVINEGVHYGEDWMHQETALDPTLRLLTFDPGAFTETVRSLIDAGQVVVRLGRHSVARIEVSDPSFIDYAHHPLRCDALDIGLAARARLVLSTQTGPDSVALAFGRPVTYFDVARLKYAFFDVASVHWQPAVLVNSREEKLSLSRQISEGILTLKTPEDFARRGIRVLRSDPAEYVHIAHEGLSISSGFDLLHDEDAELQERARAIIGRGIASGAFELRGRPTAVVSPRFLRMNPWWLEDAGG